MNKIRKYYPSDVVRRVIHELSVVGLKGTECKVEGKLAVKCVASEHLSLLFFIGARGWVLTDTSGYVNKDTSTGIPCQIHKSNVNCAIRRSTRDYRENKVHN